MATTLRVSDHTRVRASSLAAASGSSIGDVIERALDTYERALFWEETRRALARGPHEDALEDADEVAAWDRTSRDGLDGE